METNIALTGKTFSPGTFGHPRPQLQRDWFSLNGDWDFALDVSSQWTRPTQVKWNSQIVVPYSPETPESGINHTGFLESCWYRRTFAKPRLARGERLVLNFGAVDYAATVWINGAYAGAHEGGYTPFSIDMTNFLKGRKLQTIVVRAQDDPLDMEKPRGKQDWKEQPHAIWYPRTSGIWQTVWMERLPATAIDSVRWNASVKDWSVTLHAGVVGHITDMHTVKLTMRHGDRVLVHDTYGVNKGAVSRTITLPDPGIGDARGELLWHPDRPNIIDVELELLSAHGKVVDRVTSYTAMRSLTIEGDKFVINGDVCRLRLALNQGYWERTGLSAPDDEAFKRDVELAKNAGFNGVRMHQKIENPRFLYWADRLGLLVWEEMPSIYSFSQKALTRLAVEWLAVLKRDVSHPCIVTWVPFNESWGVPDLPLSADQRNFIRGVVALTRAFDAMRPVIGNSGWENPDGDMYTIHDYDSNPVSFAARYPATDEGLLELVKRVRPGGKQLVLDGAEFIGKPMLIDEFGGIKFTPDAPNGDGSWGYSVATSADDLLHKYGALVAAVRWHPRICGFCWTQLYDTYQEANGLYKMDRSEKVPTAALRHATLG